MQLFIITLCYSGTHGYELVPDVNMKKGIEQQNVVVGLVVWVEFFLAKV